MSNQGNAVTVSKAKIAQFVHDAADMEKREYILRGIAAKLYEEAERLKSDADWDVRCAEREVRDINDNISELNDKISKQKVELETAEINLNNAEKKNKMLLASKESKNFISRESELIKKPENEEVYEEYKKKLSEFKTAPERPKFFDGLLMALFMYMPLGLICTVTIICTIIWLVDKYIFSKNLLKYDLIYISVW